MTANLPPPNVMQDPCPTKPSIIYRKGTAFLVKAALIKAADSAHSGLCVSPASATAQTYADEGGVSVIAAETSASPTSAATAAITATMTRGIWSVIRN